MVVLCVHLISLKLVCVCVCVCVERLLRDKPLLLSLLSEMPLDGDVEQRQRQSFLKDVDESK